MKYVLPAVLGIIFVFLVAVMVLEVDLVNRNIETKQQTSFSQLQDRQLVKIKILSSDVPEESQQKIEVEIVNTPDSRALGLSGRSEIGADGMLFLFPKAKEQYFWMKDMQFDIDIIWIQDGVVQAVTKNVSKPEESTPDNKLETYPSGTPVNMVLEVAAGDSDSFGLKPGATIQLVD